MSRARWLVPASLPLLAGTAAAHGGSLGGGAAAERAVPTWLVLLTGGAVVGASFLLSTFLTDRALVRALHAARRPLPVPRRLLRWAGRALGLAGLGTVLAAGLLGPTDPQGNAAVLLVWVGWWAGLVMVAYLLGDPWPAVDPVRTLGRLLPRRDREGDCVGGWLAVPALLAVVFVEVVTPLASDPRLLAAAVGGYVALALAGAAALGPRTWTRDVDPLARVFELYGLVSPVARTEAGLALRPPGAGLVGADLRDSDVAAVVALLWGTTFDGLVATPAFAAAAAPVLDAGVPAALLYAAVLAAGFLAFLAAYRLAAGAARRTAPTCRSRSVLARRFAVALVPIAAGYHLAHYLGYLLRLAPSLAQVPLDPLGTATLVLVLPGWLGVVSLCAVLAGHVLAVWVGHAVAFETFAGRLQAVRSQYALALVLVGYTVVSLWIVSQPTRTPPGL